MEKIAGFQVAYYDENYDSKSENIQCAVVYSKVGHVLRGPSAKNNRIKHNSIVFH